jgi:predicted transcriptional regulator of viral defense system
MSNNLRSLGPSESKVVLSLREQERSIVHAADIVALLGSEASARKVIRNLIRKGWFSRIVGGKYMLLPPEYGPENLGENNVLALAAAVVDQSFVGWWSAAAWHGFTAQKPMTVFVATLRQTLPRTTEGSDIRFIKVVPRKFFGQRHYDVYGRSVPISSPEKTLVDCLDRPDLAGGAAELTRITDSALSMTDIPELLAAAYAMKSRALLQRLGFLADLVGRPIPEQERQLLRSAIPKTYRSYFGRSKPLIGDIGYVAAWGLLVNARQSELLSEVPRRRLTEVF